jgi:hypothetical protein
VLSKSIPWWHCGRSERVRADSARLTLVVGQCELADYNSQPQKSAMRVIIVHRSESEGQPTLSAAPASDQAALPAALGPATQPLQPRAKAPRPAQTQRDQETSCHTTANEPTAWLPDWSSIREPTRPVPDAKRPATGNPVAAKSIRRAGWMFWTRDSSGGTT